MERSVHWALAVTECLIYSVILAKNNPVVVSLVFFVKVVWDTMGIVRNDNHSITHITDILFS
jgi:hypothetical protein